MIGKFLPLSKKEYDSLEHFDWEYVKSKKSNWVDFDFEESSIDLGVICEPRIVVNDTMYKPIHQLFISEGGQVMRLIVGAECVKKNPPPYYNCKVTTVIHNPPSPPYDDDSSGSTTGGGGSTTGGSGSGTGSGGGNTGGPTWDVTIDP